MRVLKVGSILELDPIELKFDEKNRRVSDHHVARLKNSIARKNLLYLKPILVNTKGIIIDGQHRVKAAMELELQSIPCLIVNATVDDAAMLNQHSKNWNSVNFAEYWAAQGKKDYITFIKFLDDTHLKSSTAIQILAKGETYHISNFKAGTFRVGNVAKAYEFTELLNDFRESLPTRHTMKSYLAKPFVMALWLFTKTQGYDHKRMMKGHAKIGLKHTEDRNDYIRQLNNIYEAGK